MTRRILILLDGLKVRKEVTVYSVELARRMGAALHLLMLLRWEDSAGAPTHPEKRGILQRRAISDEADRVVRTCIDEIRGSGVETAGAVRQGDPSSELLKYFAENGPFQAVVWGGNEAFLRRMRRPVRTHWLERVREQLDCTLVVPRLKKGRAGGGSITEGEGG